MGDGCKSGFRSEMYSVRARTLHRDSTIRPAGIGCESGLKSEMHSIDGRGAAYVKTGNYDTEVQVAETQGLDHHLKICRVVNRCNEGARPFMNFIASTVRGVTKRDCRLGAASKSAA